MALINKSNYTVLSGVSTEGGGEKGPFNKVFLCGEPREEQEVGKLNAFYDYNNPDINQKYLFRNKTEVFFVPMFVKKIRELRLQNPNDKNRYTLVYFSWDPDSDVNPPSDAKCAFIIAGALLDENLKPVADRKDPTRTTFIYFKCDGVKVGGYIDYSNELNKKAQTINPLSDDKDFERNVVLPRRFITKATMMTAKTDHGTKYVFKFEPFKLLSDDSIIGKDGKEGLMDRCVKWVDPFKQQFNLTSKVRNPSMLGVSHQVNSNGPAGVPKFEDQSGKKKESDVKLPKEDFDLGI